MKTPDPRYDLNLWSSHPLAFDLGSERIADVIRTPEAFAI